VRSGIDTVAQGTALLHGTCWLFIADRVVGRAASPLAARCAHAVLAGHNLNIIYYIIYIILLAVHAPSQPHFWLVRFVQSISRQFLPVFMGHCRYEQAFSFSGPSVQRTRYNEDLNELVVARSETKGTALPASTAHVNNRKSSSQGVSTRFCGPMAITDLADAPYFFALGAKVQAREPGRPGPSDLVDPRAQRGHRGPIQVPRCAKSIR
jgi:hypothetical protein